MPKEIVASLYRSVLHCRTRGCVLGVCMADDVSEEGGKAPLALSMNAL